MLVTEIIKEKKGFCHMNPIKEEEIKKAEKELGTIFSDEYKEILSEYGVISCFGHEITGICKFKRLNVVDVTLKERQNNSNVENLYVLEKTNIDDIIIWQDSKGYVYQTKASGKPIKICNSIIEYLSD